MINLYEHISCAFAPKVNEICAPLAKHLGINYFDYARFYPNNTVSVLYTDPDYVNFFLQHIAYVPTPPKMVDYGYHLWESYIAPDFLIEARDKYNHADGLTIRQPCEGYDEIINFATTPNNRAIHDFYLNNKSLINKFIYYFKERAANLINIVDTNKIDLSKIAHKTIAPDYKEIYRDIENELFDTDQQVITIDGRIVKLTPRESECLAHLTKGKSSKMIAKILEISPRTVECYFESLKIKMQCSSRLEIIAKLQS